MIPRFVASACAGLALLLALFILEESNPSVLEKRRMKKNAKASKVEGNAGKGEEMTTATPEKSEDVVEEKKAEEVVVEAEAVTETKPATLHFTQLMIISFIYEFCVRFAQGGYNSRYGIYVTRKFGISSDIFS